MLRVPSIITGSGVLLIVSNIRRERRHTYNFGASLEAGLEAEAESFRSVVTDVARVRLVTRDTGLVCWI